MIDLAPSMRRWQTKVFARSRTINSIEQNGQTIYEYPKYRFSRASVLQTAPVFIS